MTQNYLKAYPKYKQQALNRITSVLIDILKETDFFRSYPQTVGYADKFFIHYDKCYFEEDFRHAIGGYG